MINERYQAGFTDADGSISVQAYKSKDNLFTIQPNLQWSQRSDRRKVIDLMPGNTRVKSDTQVMSSIAGQEAATYLNRIKNHLVVKRTEADFILSHSGSRVTEDTLKAIKKAHKAIRRDISEHGKVTHSRAWAAGYFDGDGCIYSRVRQQGNSYYLETTLNLSSWIYQPEGIELMQKAWGGKIRRTGDTIGLWVTINPQNAQKILQPLMRYTILKTGQIAL